MSFECALHQCHIIGSWVQILLRAECFRCSSNSSLHVSSDLIMLLELGHHYCQWSTDKTLLYIEWCTEPSWHIPYLFGYKPSSAISRDPKLLMQKINLIDMNCKCIILGYKPRPILGLDVYYRLWNFRNFKIQIDIDWKIILKAIKWIRKIRNKQVSWSWGEEY